jgi:hypothetical protein
VECTFQAGLFCDAASKLFCNRKMEVKLVPESCDEISESVDFTQRCLFGFLFQRHAKKQDPILLEEEREFGNLLLR